MYHSTHCCQCIAGSSMRVCYHTGPCSLCNKHSPTIDTGNQIPPWSPIVPPNPDMQMLKLLQEILDELRGIKKHLQDAEAPIYDSKGRILVTGD